MRQSTKQFLINGAINTLAVLSFIAMVALALALSATIIDTQDYLRTQESVCKRSAITPQEYAECDKQ